MASDWLKLLNEQTAVAEELKAEITTRLAASDLTMGEASSLYAKAERSAQKMDMLLKRMEDEGEDDLYDVASMIESVLDRLSVVAAKKVRMMQGLPPIEFGEDEDEDDDGGDDEYSAPVVSSAASPASPNEYVPPVAAPAVHTRAKRVIVLDAETTGVQRYDRIVTLGAVRLEGAEVGKALHLVFDPRKDSDPGAYAVHGWDDWTTRYQDLFADLAPRIFEWLSWADEIVAHNASFDMHYVQRELRKAEVGQLTQPVTCTMEMSRTKWRGQSAKLDDCLSRVGLSRVGQQHGALEDAALTAGLLLNMTGQSSWLTGMLKAAKHWPGPSNAKPAPPRPAGELPRRAPKRAMS